MHPKYLSIKDYQYDLPENRIAKFPLPERHQSQLLVYEPVQNQTTNPYLITTYQSLAEHLPKQSLLVVNNTKVVEARILFQKPTGGVIELFCLEPDSSYPDITTAMLQKGKVRWKCLVGGAKKWKEPILSKVILNGANSTNQVAVDSPTELPDQGAKEMVLAEELILLAERIKQEAEAYIIEFSWNDADLSFAEMLHLAGLIPLPPYLNRAAEDADAERYQTIYAKFDGSVAAPTAGLHFTDTVFESLKAKNISTDFVTLHVGAGTFKPVKAEQMDGHEMHAEFIDVPIQFVFRLIAQIKLQLNLKKLQKQQQTVQQSPQQSPQQTQKFAPIIPVGTTSMRTLESLYWLGLKTIQDPNITLQDLTVHQWDPYEMNVDEVEVDEMNIDGINEVEMTAELIEKIRSIKALTALVQWMERNHLQQLITKTQIIIAPGYQFRICQALITNFHQPQSTLLLLVAALIGEQWKDMYTYALENNFRFLSYGDGCLLWGNTQKYIHTLK